MLYVVATPIGNLEDISRRALDILNLCDAILCEDTRHSLKLLERYGIKKKLISYHKFKEKETLNKILEELKRGKTLALISDAGTPCINDPGQILVDACRIKELPVSAIPGPCSVIQALVLSGFDTKRFQFIGFLPKKPKKAIQEALAFPGTTIAFESPERLISTLKLIDGMREIAVIREMTKTFEECRRGRALEVLEYYEKNKPKGEIILLFKAGNIPDDLAPAQLVKLLQNYFGLGLKEAIKKAAQMKDLPKREIYRNFHE